MWLTILSDQLPIVALVSRYLTNKLIGRRLIFERFAPFIGGAEDSPIVFSISIPFGMLFLTQRQITYALLTLSPLSSQPKL